MYTPSVWLWGLYAVHSRRTRESCDVPDLNEQRVDWSLIGGGPPTPHCCHHQKKTNDLLKSKLIFKLTHRIFLREILSAFIFKHYRHFFSPPNADEIRYAGVLRYYSITPDYHLPPSTTENLHFHWKLMPEQTSTAFAPKHQGMGVQMSSFQS